ncbi:unnamed protein product [Choristocarpus tenellus]
MNRLVKHGAEALKPRRNGVKWFPPQVSQRKAKVLRKQAIRDGTFGTIEPSALTAGEIVGWDPQWDHHPPRAPSVGRPPKLHKNQRNRAERAEKITVKLAEQPKRMEELKKARNAGKQYEEGIMGLIKRLNNQGKKRR